MTASLAPRAPPVQLRGGRGGRRCVFHLAVVRSLVWAALLLGTSTAPLVVEAALPTDGSTFMQVEFASPKSTPGFSVVSLVRIHAKGTRQTVVGSSSNQLAPKQQVSWREKEMQRRGHFRVPTGKERHGDRCSPGVHHSHRPPPLRLRPHCRLTTALTHAR
jgi:hypothetical protein